MWWLILVVIGVSLLSVLLAFYATVSIRVVNRYLLPKKRTDDYLAQYEAQEKGLDPALLLLPTEDFYRTSRYGYRLHARYYVAEVPTNRTIIDFHGHNSSGVSQLKYLKLFRALGYNVFIPDHRFSGQSEGKNITFGDRETVDALDWMAYLRQKFPQVEFGVYGESMGGAIALRVASAEKPKFVISYAAYNTITELFNDHSKGKAKFFMPAIYLYAYLRTSARLWKINGEKTVKKIQCPILLMHSNADTLILRENERKIFAAAKAANKEVREQIFQNSKHTRSWSVHKQQFETAVSEFIRDCEEDKK